MASKSIICDACPTDEKFGSKADLSRHYSVFHKSGKIPCPQCKVEISTMTNLKVHLKTHGPNRIRGLKCTVDQRDKRLYTAQEVQEHLLVHSSKRPFPCPLKCGKRFKSKGEAKSHILSHTQDKPHKCGQCGRSFGLKAVLNMHIKRQHTLLDERPHGCTQCGMKFKTMGTLKNHIQNIHTSRTKDFLCSLCPMKFFTKTHLTRHSEKHDSERKLLNCYFCSQKLTTLQHLGSHLRLHTTEKPFSCPEKSCNYSATTSTVCRSHVRNNHEQSLRRKHPCYFCGATSTNNGGTLIHMRTHTLEEPFSCKLCEKSFNQWANLKSHIGRNHTKEKPHKCSLCEKCFVTGGELKGHFENHEKEKRFIVS